MRVRALRLKIVLPSLLAFGGLFPVLANAELIYLDCYHSLVQEDGSLADHKMPSRVVIDLENKIVEEDRKVFEGELV